MDTVTEIKDNHKRAFALGFKFLFNLQKDKMHQSAFAQAANVAPAVITNILKGYEKRFPGWKAQNRIAAVFNTDVFTIVDIGKKIESGKSVSQKFYMTNVKKEPKPKHSDAKVQEFIDGFNLDCYAEGLDNLSAYEEEIIKICRSFKEDKEFMQDFYNFAGDLFVSYQARLLKKLKKK